MPQLDEFLDKIGIVEYFILYIMYYDCTRREMILRDSTKKDHKPAGRPRLYEEVVEEIGLRIVGGIYAVDEVLPIEEDLVEEFGVSRTVIREAVKVLTEKGLLRPRARLGTVVLPRKQWNLLDTDVLNWELIAGRKVELLRKVTEARRIIEPEAAALAAQRATDQEIQAIAEAYHRMELNVDDAKTYIEADMVFHSAILAACHNEVLEQMANMMRRALVASREVTTQIPGSSVGALPLHLKVLEAIQQRNAETAYAAMQYLIDQARADIESILGEQKDS